MSTTPQHNQQLEPAIIRLQVVCITATTTTTTTTTTYSNNNNNYYILVSDFICTSHMRYQTKIYYKTHKGKLRDNPPNPHTEHISKVKDINYTYTL